MSEMARAIQDITDISYADVSSISSITLWPSSFGILAVGSILASSSKSRR